MNTHTSRKLVSKGNKTYGKMAQSLFGNCIAHSDFNRLTIFGQRCAWVYVRLASYIHITNAKRNTKAALFSPKLFAMCIISLSKSIRSVSFVWLPLSSALPLSALYLPLIFGYRSNISLSSVGLCGCSTIFCVIAEFRSMKEKSNRRFEYVQFGTLMHFLCFNR